MNESEQFDDLRSEKEDIVGFVATDATPVALTTREIEHESELDPNGRAFSITLRPVAGPNVILNA